MSSVSSVHLQRHFYRSNWQYLPVFSRTAKNDYKIVGFLTRKKLNSWMSDLERCEQSHLEIPLNLIDNTFVPEELIVASSQGVCPPILLTNGQLLDVHQQLIPSQDLLRVLLAFRKHLALKNNSKNHLDHQQAFAYQQSFTYQQQTTENTSHKDWLGQSLLAVLPWPMLAINLYGKSLFYNQPFTDQILSSHVVEKSLLKAEKYFESICRDCLANDTGESNRRALYLSSMQVLLSIFDLENEHRDKFGYLLIFFSDQELQNNQLLARTSLQKCNFPEFMNNMEKLIISTTLQSNDFNISHSAQKLSLRRSTLQHKIKKFRIRRSQSATDKNSISKRKTFDV